MLPSKLREYVNSSPTSMTRLSVKSGAQSVGEERGGSFPGQCIRIEGRRGEVVWPMMTLVRRGEAGNVVDFSDVSDVV